MATPKAKPKHSGRRGDPVSLYPLKPAEVVRPYLKVLFTAIVGAGAVVALGLIFGNWAVNRFTHTKNIYIHDVSR
jgi:hypothetical protein